MTLASISQREENVLSWDTASSREDEKWLFRHAALCGHLLEPSLTLLSPSTTNAQLVGVLEEVQPHHHTIHEGKALTKQGIHWDRLFLLS